MQQIHFYPCPQHNFRKQTDYICQDIRGEDRREYYWHREYATCIWCTILYFLIVIGV